MLASMLIAIGRPLKAASPGDMPGFNGSCKTITAVETVKLDSLSNTRKNILSIDILIMFPAFGYSRIIQVTEKTGIVAYGSITPFFGFTIDLGAALTFGGKNHHFEPGGGYLLNADFLYVKAGYRYQGQKGFVFRIAPGFSITENVPWWTVGFGYAF